MKLLKKLFILWIMLGFSVHESKCQSFIHFFDNYTTVGYSIERIPNSNYFALAGTLYKTPILNSCSSWPDSADIHFLIIDEEGKIILNKVFDSGANDFAYHITTYDETNQEFLITACTIGIDPNCSTLFSSLTYLVVNISGTLTQKHSFNYYDPNLLFGTTANCPYEIGERDIRPFKSIVSEDGIVTVGMVKNFMNLQGTNFLNAPKSGFIKKVTKDFSQVWDQLFFNNNTPCLGFNDYDCLENITEIPDLGYLITGTTTIEKVSGSVYDQAVVACLIGYNGSMVYDWSHYSTSNNNTNISAASSYFSKSDKIVYVLENDEFNNTIRVVGFDPYSLTYSSNFYTLDYNNVNPDIKVMAYEIEDNPSNANQILIVGLAQQINAGINYYWTPFVIVFDKSLPISGIAYIQQSGASNNSYYNQRGDEVHSILGQIPITYTPKMFAFYSKPSAHEMVSVGYDYSTILNQYGLKFVLYDNLLLSNSTENSCYQFLYDAIRAENSNIEFNVSHYPVTTDEGIVNYDELVIIDSMYTCLDEGGYKSNSMSAKSNSRQILYNDKNSPKSDQFAKANNEIEVFNLLGQLLLRSTEINFNQPLDKQLRSQLASGVYIIKYKLNKTSESTQQLITLF